MSVTTASGPVIAGQSWIHTTRVALVALAIVALLAVSFIIGRTTVSSAKQAPAIAPATAPASHVHTNAYLCRMGRAC